MNDAPAIDELPDVALDPQPIVEPAIARPPPVVAAANPIHDVLALCGVNTAAARATFINIEGLDSIDAFAMLNGDSDVTEMAKRMASRSGPTTGRVILGTMQIKRIQALVYWVKDHHKRNLIVDPEMWTEEEVQSTLQRKEAEQNFKKIDVDLIDPGKCDTIF